MVCRDCGSVGVAKRSNKGSLGVEILLWLVGLIGIVTVILPLIALWYSLRRLGKTSGACAACGGTGLVPPDSPVGLKLMKQAGYEKE